MDQRELAPAVILAALAGLALACYRYVHRGRSIEYHLFHHNRAMYYCHKTCLALLWTTLAVNARFVVLAGLKAAIY